MKVRALKTVKDNGVEHAVGEVFEMEPSLVGAHIGAGQVVPDGTFTGAELQAAVDTALRAANGRWPVKESPDGDA